MTAKEREPLGFVTADVQRELVILEFDAPRVVLFPETARELAAELTAAADAIDQGRPRDEDEELH